MTEKTYENSDDDVRMFIELLSLMRGESYARSATITPETNEEYFNELKARVEARRLLDERDALQEELQGMKHAKAALQAIEDAGYVVVPVELPRNIIERKLAAWSTISHQ
jgi:hypothetical protein